MINEKITKKNVSTHNIILAFSLFLFCIVINTQKIVKDIKESIILIGKVFPIM